MLESGHDTSEATQTKVCCRCGKDLTGHTRFKDSLGYWCKECHRSEKKEREGERCSECGRAFPPEKLTEWEGEYRCATCEKARQKEVFAKLRQQAKKKGYWKLEMQRIQWLVIILVLLALIIVMQKLGWIGR